MDKQESLLSNDNFSSQVNDNHFGVKIINYPDNIINSEPYTSELISFPITPKELFYKRNHYPIPKISTENYSVKVYGEVLNPGVITLDEIKKLKKHTVEATLMCAGNRRSEFSVIKETEGLQWKAGTVANALWAGSSLRDIFDKFHLKDSCLHVEFIGGGQENEDFEFSTSIPISKAYDQDVILCYEMNGKPLSQEHGYPIRMIVPGYIGARMVKWVSAINFRIQESQGKYHKYDYKLFNSSVTSENINQTKWEKAEAILEINTNSFICNLYEDQTIKLPFVAKGYAYSNGNKIWRVEFSVDDGKIWKEVSFKYQNQSHGKSYSWVLWEYNIEKIYNQRELKLSVRAWDSSNNTQPLEIKDMWNFRGYMNNTVHKVKINVEC